MTPLGDFEAWGWGAYASVAGGRSHPAVHPRGEGSTLRVTIEWLDGVIRAYTVERATVDKDDRTLRLWEAGSYSSYGTLKLAVSMPLDSIRQWRAEE